MNPPEKLLEFIDNLKGLLENTQDVILIKDTEFNYIGGSLGLYGLLDREEKEVIGGSDYVSPWVNFSHIYRYYDHEVMKGKWVNCVEPFSINKKTFIGSKVIRYPILDDKKTIMGIFAHVSIIPVINPDKKDSNLILPEPINNFSKLETYKINEYHQSLNLTKRETETLFLLIRGKNSREIGAFLGISYRTVEIYIQNIKEKMNVSKRSEIIAKSLDNNMFNIVPEKSILEKLCLTSKQWQDFFCAGY